MQSLGIRRVERGETKREGKQSGRTSEASSGVDGRAGSSVGEGSLRGAQPGLARRASQNKQCHVAGYEQPVLFGREQFSCRERQLSLSWQAQASSTMQEGSGELKPLIATRAQEVAAMLDETLRFHVKATGKDESLMRGQFTRIKLGESSERTRPLKNPRGGETTAPRQERRSVGAVPETTEIGSGAKIGVRAGVQAESAKVLTFRFFQCRRKVSASVVGRSAQNRSGTRPKEGSQRGMEQEDSNSQRRRAWDKIWDRRVLAPFLVAGN